LFEGNSGGYPHLTKYISFVWVGWAAFVFRGVFFSHLFSTFFSNFLLSFRPRGLFTAFFSWDYLALDNPYWCMVGW
jgi:hypothetical protein